MYILSQILVVLSDIFCIISMISKNKKNVVFYLIFSTILFGAQYMCLEAWTGAAIAMVELIFLIIMFVLETKNKIQYNTLLSIITIVVTVVLSILTWESWVSALPMSAMIIYLLAMMFENVIIVKSGTFIRLILNSTYMLLVKSYFGAAISVFILVFTIYGIIRDNKEKNKVNNDKVEI